MTAATKDQNQPVRSLTESLDTVNYIDEGRRSLLDQVTYPGLQLLSYNIKSSFNVVNHSSPVASRRSIRLMLPSLI